MIDTKVRKLLIGGSDEDFQVGAALIAKKGLVREGLYAFEDVAMWTEKMHLTKVQQLQIKYPEIIISGSVALFLHGCRSSRWDSKTYKPDFDLILPRYMVLEGPGIVKVADHPYPSGNDFDEVYSFEEVKLDVRIDPYQRWEWIKYDGFDYKVSDPLDIIAAKIKYVKQSGGGKHRMDLHDFIGKTTFGEFLSKANSSKELTL